MKAMRLAGICFLVMMLVGPSARASDLFSRLLESVQQGNQQYDEQHYEKALENYERAENQIEGEPAIHFNRGNALYQLERTKEAREAYLRAMGSDDRDFKKRVYYNIGNTFLREQSFEDAITYYQRALEIDPAFDDARYNLELALKAIEQQKEQSNKDDSKQDKQQEDKEKQGDDKQDQKNQDEKKKDENQEKDQKDQEQQDEQKDKQEDKKEDQQKQDQQQKQQQDQQQNQDQQQQKSQPEQQQQQQQPEQQEQPLQLTPAQIQDLLDAERENEKPFQMQQFNLPEYDPQDRTTQKDW